MAKPCSICHHDELAKINSAMISGGGTYREISARFAISKSALARHRSHLTKAVRKVESDPDYRMIREWAVLDRMIREWEKEALEVTRQILEASREPVVAGRISKRKTASRRRPTALSRLKKC